MNGCYVTIVDLRMPNINYCRLVNHLECINSIAWNPNKSNQIASGSANGDLLVWDIGSENEIDTVVTKPLYNIVGRGEVLNVVWKKEPGNYLGILRDCFMQLVNFSE